MPFVFHFPELPGDKEISVVLMGFFLVPRPGWLGTPPCTHQHLYKLLGRSQPWMPHKPLSALLLNHKDSSPEGPGQHSSHEPQCTTLQLPLALISPPALHLDYNHAWTCNLYVARLSRDFSFNISWIFYSASTVCSNWIIQSSSAVTYSLVSF